MNIINFVLSGIENRLDTMCLQIYKISVHNTVVHQIFVRYHLRAAVLVRKLLHPDSGIKIDEK